MHLQRSWTVAAILLSACCGSYEGTLQVVRFDGVYHNRAFGETCYLRSYSDGTVIDVCSTDPPRAIIESLNRNWPDASRGRYYLCGQHISFSSLNPAGVVDYSGTAAHNCLFLQYHSWISNRQGTQTFTFTQVPQTPPNIVKRDG